LSYAEATSALPETGGAATFVRRSMNDLAGFMTGWALFLDYLIVIALSALFVPHYLGAAFRVDALERHPWDVVVAICSIVLVGAVVTIYVAIAVVAVSAFPGPDTALGHRWLRAPLVGVAEQVRGQVPLWLGDTIRFFVGASGALILLTAITTSISGFSRLAYSF